MKKFLNISLILLITGYGLLIAVPSSYADRLTRDDYVIPATSINSGGDRLTRDDYVIQDSKGEPVIGRMTRDDYTLDLGVVYGVLGDGAVVPPPAEWVDDPHVRNLWISRNPASPGDLTIRWTKEPADYAGRYYVFVLEDEFGNAAAGWRLAAETRDGADHRPVEDATLRDHDRAYFRVLSVNEVERVVNKPAVGYIKVALPANGLKLMSSPFYDGNVADVFPMQLADGMSLKLYPRAGTGLDVVTATSGGVAGQNFAVNPAVGFWLRNENDAPITLTICGTMDASFERDIATLDLTGNPLPGPLDITTLGAERGDIVYQQAGTGLNPWVKTDVWSDDLSIGVGEGLWFRTAAGERYWSVNVQRQQAVIGTR